MSHSLYIPLAPHSTTEQQHDNKQDGAGKDSGPYLKKSRLSADELAENADDVSWKKLSSSSKMRNYRDGKYRDSELLYKERPPRSSGGDGGKRSSHREDLERVSKSDYHRSDRENRKYDDRDKKNDAKSSSSSRRSRNDRTSSRRRSTSRSRDVLQSSSSWARKSSPSKESRSTSSKNYKHSRHSEREGVVDVKGEEKDHERSHRHRHHHHRHHHSTSKSDREKSLQKTAESSSKTVDLKSAKSSSTYQAYPVIKSFDSKQIYSDGIKLFFILCF